MQAAEAHSSGTADLCGASDEQRLEEIRQFLCRKYGADEAQVEIQRDPGLFGGFILHVGSDEYGWSLKKGVSENARTIDLEVKRKRIQFR